MVDSELATLGQIVLDIEDGANEKHSCPERKHIFDAEENCEGQLDMTLADTCISL